MGEMRQYKSTDKATGIVYVYEGERFWDKDKKQARWRNRRCIGHVDPDTGEVVENRERRRPAAKPESPAARRTFCGVSEVFAQAAALSGVSGDLERAVGPERARLVMSCAAFLAREASSPMSRQAAWARANGMPEIPSQRASELFASIGEAEKEAFCRLRAARLSDGEYWVYDTTSISSYSEALCQVRWGRNKDRVPLPQLNLGVCIGNEGGMPFHYRRTAGNVPDVSTVRKLIGEAPYLDVKKAKLLGDRGFYSKANVDALMDAHMKFVIGAKVGLSYVREAIDANRGAMMAWGNHDYERGLYGLKAPIEWDHETGHPRLGTVERSKKRAYLHLFYSQRREVEEMVEVDRTVVMCKRELDSGNPLDAHQRYYDAWFERSRGRWIPDEAAIAAARENAGWFAVLTNDASLTCWDVDDMYRRKDRVEKAFGDVKGRLDVRTPRVSSEETLDGKLFCVFVALVLTTWLRNAMRESGLADGYTLDALLDEVSCIERFDRPGRRPTIGETTVKQREIFEKLGMTLPA